jgi:hypothetical protein
MIALINKRQASFLTQICFAVEDTAVRSYASAAVMGITTTDEGKREMLPTGGAAAIVGLLTDKVQVHFVVFTSARRHCRVSINSFV